MKSAVKCFPTLREPRCDTWLTPDATAELGPLIKQSSECRRLLSRRLGDVPQLLNQKRSVKKAIKLCVVTHKKIFRQKLATIASSSHNTRPKWAMRMLAGGLDTNLLAEPKARRIDVRPARFKEHFENLFSKVSQQQTLNLTEDRVGPKSEVRMDLAGPPTVFEVQLAISKLQEGSAPGSNGLRPEVFKAGGAVLAHSQPDPSHAPDSESRADIVGDEDPETSPGVSSSSDRAKVFQA
jgi:hypothetical protein